MASFVCMASSVEDEKKGKREIWYRVWKIKVTTSISA